MKPPKFIKNILNQKWFIYTDVTNGDVSYYRGIINAFASDDNCSFLFDFAKDDLKFGYKKPWITSIRIPDIENSLSIDRLFNTYVHLVDSPVHIKKIRNTLNIMLFRHECKINHKVPVLMFFNKHYRLYIDLSEEYKLLWYEKK